MIAELGVFALVLALVVAFLLAVLKPLVMFTGFPK